MKNGFTLIELLAVIVILAIIALIATPIVLDIINDSKESATLRSAEFYVDGVEHSIATAILKNQTVKDGTYDIMEDGNICIGKLEDSLCKADESIQGSGYVLEVNVKGEKPKEGTITISSGQVSETELIISNNEIWKNPTTGKIEIKQEETNTPEVVLAPGLYDENDKLLMSWDELNESTRSLAKEYSGGTVEINFDNIVSGDSIYVFVSMVIGEQKDATKLVISENITSIGPTAFHGCESLEEIIIPNGVTSIGTSAFEGCTSLTSIIIPEGVTTIDNGTFQGCESLTNITIPDSVTSIGTSAFQGCTSLTSITIPDSVTSIGDYAFKDCTSLTSITIPDSVTSIEAHAFSYCEGLTNITIPEGVTTIYDGTFEGCTSLTSIKILNSNTAIGEFAFDGCGNLEVFYKGEHNGETWGAESVNRRTDF